MDIQHIEIYVAGYVGDCGAEVVFMTHDQEFALEWTAQNQKYGSLPVFRGLTQDDLDCDSVDRHYIEDHLIDKGEVCGYSGIYTNLYLSEVEKMAA